MRIDETNLPVHVKWWLDGYVQGLELGKTIGVINTVNNKAMWHALAWEFGSSMPV